MVSEVGLATGSAPLALGEPEENLAAFMSRHDQTPADLMAQVGPAFGELSLVVGTGSVVVGYANERSDVDVYAVGDVRDTQRVPIVSHELGALVDISLIEESALRTQLTALEASPRLLGGGGDLSGEWKSTRRALDQAIRLAYGVVLAATPEWIARQAGLRRPWLRDRACSWWQLEAHRRLLMARWLENANAPLAAQLACDARLAALKSHTAAAGYWYLNQKWLSTELSALGRGDLLEVYRASLRDAWDVTVPLQATAGLVVRLIGAPPPSLVVEAAYVPGVATHAMRDGTLVSRWEMRGAKLTTTGLPPARRGGRPIWSGALEDTPPEWLHELTQLGMVWVGVRDATP